MKQQPYNRIIKEAVHIYYAESSSLLFTKKFQLFYERLLVSSMFYKGKKSDLKTEFKGFKAELPLGQCWELLWKKHFYRLLFEPSHPARWPQRVLDNYTQTSRHSALEGFPSPHRGTFFEVLGQANPKPSTTVRKKYILPKDA